MPHGNGDYRTFLERKTHLGNAGGFEPLWLPDMLFPFQRDLTTWAIQQGRAAIFADCGLGKTPMQLVWAENVLRHTNRSVLILTPLAVAAQTVREGEKFGVLVHRDTLPNGHPGIIAANYERLHHYSPDDFAGVVCDESSILKNFDGKRRAAVTDFLRKRPYRLLCTATAAPNDYVELGTSSEALGMLGHMDMLGRFFRNVEASCSTKAGHYRGMGGIHRGDYAAKFWRFKRHAETPFWRWVCSWSRALRRPSDLGYEDAAFVLPELCERETVIEARTKREGALFDLPAVGLAEQREECRRTIRERCEAVAEKLNGNSVAVTWCHLNDEGDLLTSLIPDAVQVKGSDSDDRKEEVFLAFARGEIRVLVTKPRIGAFGLNWQHCAHMTFFPSHSFEQYYQSVRRCWRFGQLRPVTVDVVSTPGEKDVLANLQRKAAAADKMFDSLVRYMNEALHVKAGAYGTRTTEVPSWL